MRIVNAMCLCEAAQAWHCSAHEIIVADGRIAEIIPSAGAGRDPSTVRTDETFDAAGLLAIPGLVNAHTHSPDNLIRGSVPDLPLELWSLHSAAGRERRSPREIRISALLGAVEMLRTGTTTLLDHIRLSPEPDGDGLDAAAQAYRDVGIRAVIAPVVADRPVAETLPLDPEDLGDSDISAYGRRPTMPAAEQIAILEDFIRRWHGVDGRLFAAVGPSGPQRCSDVLLTAAQDLAARHGLILHTHVLETLAQQVMGHRLYGKGMLRHLADLGLLGPRTNLVHALWLDEGDIELIAQTDTAVVHNPVSNARLGSGVFRLPEFLRNGIRVALGTDSACCNDSNNLLETTKWATILHNLGSPDPERWISPDTALTLATRGGAGALGLGAITGRLVAGHAADITFLRLASPAFAPLSNPVRQLVLSETGAAVEHVMVAGRIVLKHGRAALLDETALWDEACELSARRIRDNHGVYRAASTLDTPIRRMYARLHARRRCCG